MAGASVGARGGFAGSAPPPPPAGRADLLRKIEEVRELRREWIRRAVLERNRIDVLARECLGYLVAPHHLAIARHQHRHPEGNLVLAWRGAGKSTIGTTARVIFKLLKNPQARILIGSKSAANAVAALTDIKSRLLLPEFVDVFGDLQPAPRSGLKWDDVEFDLSTHKHKGRESNVTAVGVEGTVVSKHYDMIIGDDLVDEDGARTPIMREKTRTFFYKTLLPCLMPGGELSVIGTLYHYADLYNHLMQNEFKGAATLRIPVMTGSDAEGWVATWPEGGFTVDRMLALRQRMGSILFDSQFMLSTDKMRGEIFDLDYMPEIDDDAIPSGLPRFLGVDLAISKKESADYFAAVVIAYDRTADRIYVIDAIEARKSFREQRDEIAAMYRRHNCERGGIEATAYQEAQIQEVKAANPDLNLIPLYPKDDKVSRAFRLQGKFEDGRVFFRKGLRFLQDHLVMFPKGEHDDLFDAFDHAVTSTKARIRKGRASEPGLM